MDRRTPKTLLFFARHGETDDNKNLVFQGQSGRGLNRRGRAQAKRLGQRAKTLQPTAIVASDLERAAETAGFAGEACGLTVSLDRGLREVDVGTWTGKTYEAIAAAHPDQWEAWHAGRDVRRGGGETYAELGARIAEATRRIAEAHPGGRVLLVSHGGSIRSFVGRMLGLSSDALSPLAGVANASLTVVDYEVGGTFRLHAFNDTAHLEGLGAEEDSD